VLFLLPANKVMTNHNFFSPTGALGDPSIINVLEKYSKDPSIEVAETCEIALARVKWLQNKDLDDDNNPYFSVDPSPAAAYTKSVDELQTIMMDDNETLFTRYRALFSLRNLRTQESILALCVGLKGKSALFRHEVAFVLGQLQEKCTIPFLIENLRDDHENEMVRHECAEALGSIATEECMEILNEYLKDEKRVVKESCEVALDMCEYENSPEFQYANTLVE
jgi:deoxyhypusine monooxygenase